MPTYSLKAGEVEARQHDGVLPLVVMSDVYGTQTAQRGDYLVGTEKGKIHVVPREEFEAKYELVHAHEVPAPEKPAIVNSFAATKDGIIEQAESKSSGDNNDPGDWTQAGDGKDYPGKPVANLPTQAEADATGRMNTPVSAIFVKNADDTYSEVKPEDVKPGEIIYSKHPDGGFVPVLASQGSTTAPAVV